MLTPTDAPKLPYPWSKRRAEEFNSSQGHGPTMVAAMDCGEPVTASFFVLLRCAAEDDPFTAYKGVFQGLEERIIFSNHNLLSHLLGV